jgi:hypothetical protein
MKGGGELEFAKPIIHASHECAEEIESRKQSEISSEQNIEEEDGIPRRMARYSCSDEEFRQPADMFGTRIVRPMGPSERGAYLS